MTQYVFPPATPGGYGPTSVPHVTTLSGVTQVTDVTPPSVLTPLDTFNAGATQNLIARTGWYTSNIGGDLSAQTDSVPTYASNVSGSESLNFWGSITTANANAWVTYGSVISSFHWMWVRAQATSASLTDGYFVYADSSGYTEIWKRVANVNTLLTSGTKPTGAWLVGESLMLDATGSTLTAYYCPSGGTWTSYVSTTDTDLTVGGYIGLQVPSATTTRFDQFGGGPLVPTIAPATAGVSFGGSGAITSIPQVAGTAGVTFGASAAITAPTKIPAFTTAGVSFSGTGSITAPTFVTPATSGVTFSGTSSITAPTFITPASANVTFGASGSITTPARITPATSGVSFSGTGSITAPAYLLGPGYIPGSSIDPADLIYPDAIMNANVSFGGSGTITAGAAPMILPATTGVSFSGTGSITAPTFITPASSGVTFSGTGAITSIPRVSGTANVTFNGTGGITSIPQVSGTANVSFSGTGAITAVTFITPATGTVAFGTFGSITAPTFIVPVSAGVVFAGTAAIFVPVPDNPAIGGGGSFGYPFQNPFARDPFRDKAPPGER